MILTGAFARPRPNPDTTGPQASFMIDHCPWCGTRGRLHVAPGPRPLISRRFMQGTAGLGLQPSCLYGKDLRSCASSYTFIMPLVPSGRARSRGLPRRRQPLCAGESPQQWEATVRSTLAAPSLLQSSAWAASALLSAPSSLATSDLLRPEIGVPAVPS